MSVVNHYTESYNGVCLPVCKKNTFPRIIFLVLFTELHLDNLWGQITTATPL
jgi:hypothetical protein